MKHYTLYGIPNCDTIKKARHWLTEYHVAYTFYDYKKQNVTPALLQYFLQSFTWQQLINTRGTTWRRLDENQRKTLNDESAITLMLNYPSIIKRPILCDGQHCLLTFSPETYQHFIQENNNG